MAPAKPHKILSPLQLVEFLSQSTTAAGPEELDFPGYNISKPDGPERYAVVRGPGFKCPIQHLHPATECRRRWTPSMNRSGGFEPIDPKVAEEWIREHLIQDHGLNGRIRNWSGWLGVHHKAAKYQGYQVVVLYAPHSDSKARISQWSEWCRAVAAVDPNGMDNSEWATDRMVGAVLGALDREIRAAGFPFQIFPGDHRIAYTDPNLHPWLSPLITSASSYNEATNVVRNVLAEVIRASRSKV